MPCKKVNLSHRRLNTMKRLAIGDIHGRTEWKKLIDQEFDEIYFLGDYFDSYEDFTIPHQVDNFNEIISLARKDARIKVCLGNHDYHYLKGLEYTERYSGFQHHGYIDISEAIESAMDIIQIVYVTEDNYILSHAGVTKTFLERFEMQHPLDINERFKEDRKILKHTGYNVYGDDPANGPLWVRPFSLANDAVDGYKQIVGHTQVDQFQTLNDTIFLVDTGSNSEGFHF